MSQNPNLLVSKVELGIGCRNLTDMDVFSKSDPMAVLFQQLDDRYYEVGRTEVVKNNLNPIFATKFEVDYRFEERQMFKIEIYDSDSSSSHLSAHDFLGKFEFPLGRVVSCQTLEAELIKSTPKNNRKATVIITCQELSDCKEILILSCSGTKLDKKDTFGKSDPLIELYRCNDQVKFTPDFSNPSFDHKSFSLVYRSKPIMNTLNPSWPAFTIKLNKLCNGDKDNLIKVSCADWDSDGSQDFIGHFYTSVNHLVSMQGKPCAYFLINPKKAAKKKGYSDSGKITMNKVLLDIEYSFFDYISGGTELNFTVAIDFTASNGDPNNPKSLHYVYPNNGYGSMNQYEIAISSVGAIIQDYDTDKMFPGLGFGAKIPPNNTVSHCFPINFCPNNPFCQGVDGLLATYRTAIRSVSLYGPTNFSPVIRHVLEFAKAYQDGSKYFILLIITDGIITDFDMTLNTIIDCSHLPMSIIIVGVGNEDFSAMDALDCDKGKLRYQNKVSDRDIVQFVALRDFINSRSGLNHSALAKAVLHELPSQVCCWMHRRNIKPLPSKPNLLNVQQGDFTNCPYPGQGISPYPTSEMSHVAHTAHPTTGMTQSVPSAPPYPVKN